MDFYFCHHLLTLIPNLYNFHSSAEHRTIYCPNYGSQQGPFVKRNDFGQYNNLYLYTKYIQKCMRNILKMYSLKYIVKSIYSNDIWKYTVYHFCSIDRLHQIWQYKPQMSDLIIRSCKSCEQTSWCARSFWERMRFFLGCIYWREIEAIVSLFKSLIMMLF